MVFYGVYKKSRFCMNLVVVLYGLMSFLYVPFLSNDRARYIERYEIFSGASFGEFLAYLELRPDFLFHSLIYLFAKLGIPLQFLLMGITMFTVRMLFWTFELITQRYGIRNISNNAFFLSFVLILLSIGLQDIFSGIRFYFACSFVLAGFNFAFFLQKKLKAFLLLLVAATIHFSTFIFVPILGMLLLFPNAKRLYQGMLIGSIAFMFVPESVVYALINTLTPFQQYTGKVSLYTENQDFIQRGITEGSQNYIYVYLSSIAWSFVMYPYILFTLKRKSFFRYPLYLILSIVDILYVYTTIYSRYMLFVRFIFVFMIIDEYFRYKKKKVLYFTLGFLIIHLIIEIIKLRYNITESFFNKEMFSMIFTFFKRVTSRDFLIN